MLPLLEHASLASEPLGDGPGAGSRLSLSGDRVRGLAEFLPKSAVCLGLLSGKAEPTELAKRQRVPRPPLAGPRVRLRPRSILAILVRLQRGCPFLERKLRNGAEFAIKRAENT